MEEFSRRIWAPVQQGALRETKWFYERARGQYADAQSKLTRVSSAASRPNIPSLRCLPRPIWRSSKMYGTTIQSGSTLELRRTSPDICSCSRRFARFRCR
ncbi:AIPR family protein [Nitratireductor sp. XY-223]|uniref:AIPR family protein n=1 Tax=Nitratireductor sp. XY-223 TaxID=2561926 RepID=UPI001FEFA304|nr:AIPR family protein [Nitratireductor sp. XY-223]